VFYRERQVASGQNSVRELPLLEGERIEEQYVPDDGLVPETPHKGQLLVLTNKRVISFVQRDGTKEVFLAPLEELKGVSVKANSRGLRDLFQGFSLILVGVLSYLVLGYFWEQVAVAAVLGAAIVLVGILFLAKYLFGEEEEGSITFQGGNWELCFPYKNDRASADVYKLINRFFGLKQDASNSRHPSLDPRPEPRPPAPPFSIPPTDSPFDVW